MTEGLFGGIVEMFTANQVSPAAVYLVSEECELTGEIWSVGGGSVSRFFIGLTDGYFKHPEDGALTLEDIAGNIREIRSEIDYMVPFSSQDEFGKLGPRLSR